MKKYRIYLITGFLSIFILSYIFTDGFNLKKSKRSYRFKKLEFVNSFALPSVSNNLLKDINTDINPGILSIIPNPFNNTVEIKYYLPEEENVNLTIYNTLGQKVILLENDNKPEGLHTIIWNSNNQKGEKVSSGLYFIILKTNSFSQTKKVTLLK